MPPWIYETSGDYAFWVFLLLTVVLGGAAAWATGRAIADTWRPFWQVPVYAALLALAVRFLHFALFEEPLLAPGNLAVDYAVTLAGCALGHRFARARAMVTQYGWMYEKAGPLSWRARDLRGNPGPTRDSG
jgi:hypothetical protein